MKTMRFFLVLSVLLFSYTAHAQNSIFDKYNDMDKVSSVYISKTMIEMQPDLRAKNLYIGKVAGQLDAVYIVSTMDNNIKKNMRKDIEHYLEKGKYEMLMKQKGTVSRSAFYVKKKGNRVKELVMITDGAASLKFIVLSGDLTLKDIQNITTSQHANNLFQIPKEGVYHIDLAKLKDQFKDLKNLEDLKDLKELKKLQKLEKLKDLKELEKLGNEIMKNIDLSAWITEN